MPNTRDLHEKGALGFGVASATAACYIKYTTRISGIMWYLDCL